LLDIWRAMESLVDRGKCRAIGLSGQLGWAVADLRIRENQAGRAPSRSASVSAGNKASGILQEERLNISALPEDALDEINRIQIRQSFNEVVNTGSPGFIPQGR
jgi:hypothetical protein